MPPSPHMSQRTVPMKDNSEHRVKQLRGEDLHCKCCCDLGLEETMARVSGKRAPAFTSEELEKLVDGVLPSTRYSTVLQTNRSVPTRKNIFGGPSPRTSGPWGLPQTEHPLPEKMGGHSPLEQEDGGGSAGDGLPTLEGCPSHHDPPDVQDPGSGLPGVGSALEGIIATTRRTSGACSHRNLECTGHQGSQCGTEPQHRQSPTCEALASALRERGKTPATKATPRGPGGSVESAVTPSKVGKGHKKPVKSGKSSTAEKTAIIPAAQEATSNTSPAAQDRTASTSPAAQDRTASTSPAAQDRTASTSPPAQDRPASTSQPAQEATTSTSPAAQEATASTGPAAQEATASPGHRQHKPRWAIKDRQQKPRWAMKDRQQNPVGP
ncbi:hypothetical protein NDU88_005228 [Pleurodeles waltl]|uniref:Uncharacterized protein n=1 Tax=Pleurodeles waltl TaxID=8319 RepID=A0AAV7SL27_PLEWA|nr:hypothetical protein NDU88_005228 [Pleurodeles waltl]